MEASVSAIKPSPLRRPEEREEYRKSLYKSSPSSWRVTYVKRCRERLKESRGKFLERFRAISSEATNNPSPSLSAAITSIGQGHASTEMGGASAAAAAPQTITNEAIRSSIQEVMRKEWESMREEHSCLPELPYGTPAGKRDRRGWFDNEDPMNEGFDVGDGDVEHVLSIMDQLTAELLQEEKAILARYNQQLYEENQQFTEHMLSAAADSMATLAELICPICQKNCLQQNLHIIFCACGLRLDTAQDCVTLEFVRQQLEDCTSLHGSVCSGKPVFSLETTLGTQNIIMNCTQCEFMYIVV